MSLLDGMKLTLVQHNLIPHAWLRYQLEYDLRRWERSQQAPYPHIMKQRIVLDYAAASEARVFIETGTYYGNMLQACLGHFDKLISFEIEQHFYGRAEKVFGRRPNVTLVHGDSGELLPKILSMIKSPCLFWLDAHYSCGLTGRAKLETPIRSELEAILGHPYRHLVLIDDASSFDGTHDYPKITWIEEAARKASYSLSVSDNIIRLIAPKELARQQSQFG